MIEKSPDDVLLDRLVDLLFSNQPDIEALDNVIDELEQLSTTV